MAKYWATMQLNVKLGDKGKILPKFLLRLQQRYKQISHNSFSRMLSIRDTAGVRDVLLLLYGIV